jgi:cobalt-zinc-cadmium efflux system membrane fusion protein
VSASGNGIPDAEGVVSFISPVVDEETRTVLARVELPNRSGEWRPGLFITASVASGHRDAPLAVPKDAVQLLEGEQVVFIPEGDAFAPALVTTGLSNETHVEILSGLEPGQEYVAEGAFALKAEMITSGLDPHAGHGH